MWARSYIKETPGDRCVKAYLLTWWHGDTMTHDTLCLQNEMMIGSFAVYWLFGIFNISKREPFFAFNSSIHFSRFNTFIAWMILFKKIRNLYFQELSIFHCAQIVNHLRLMLKVKSNEDLISFFCSQKKNLLLFYSWGSKFVQ